MTPGPLFCHCALDRRHPFRPAGLGPTSITETALVWQQPMSLHLKHPHPRPSLPPTIGHRVMH